MRSVVDDLTSHMSLLIRMRQRVNGLNEALETERKRTEEKLRVAAQEWRTMFDAISDNVCLLDLEGRILRCNIATAKFLGKPFSEIIGCTYWELVHGSSEPIEGHPIVRMRETRRRETSVFQQDDRWFHTTVDPVFDEGGNLIRGVCIMTDITERKKAEASIGDYQLRLRSLASQLSLAEERERRRIATELHNSIGHALAILKIKSGALRESLPLTPDSARPLDEIGELIEQMIRDTRSLTFDLSPPILYELGLEAAMEWLAEQIQEQYGILTDFEDDEQPKPLDEDVRVLLFQAVRELLFNIAKHSQARSARVSIRREDNDIRITVEDDGIGFDTSKIDSHICITGGFGLFNLRERLDYLGGYLEIESEPSHGTQATIVAPLKREKETTRGK